MDCMGLYLVDNDPNSSGLSMVRMKEDAMCEI
jgi:hypothetical protein